MHLNATQLAAMQNTNTKETRNMKTKRNSIQTVIAAFAMLTLIGATASHGALIGHWKLDENSGATAVDSSANGNDATVNNGSIAGVTGVDGNAYDSSGGQWLSVGDVSTFDTTFDEFSVSVWAKPSSLDPGVTHFAGKLGDAGDRGWILRYRDKDDDNNYELDWVASDDASGSNWADQSYELSGTLSTSEFTHIVAVFKNDPDGSGDDGFSKIYINGTAVATLDHSLTQLNGNNNVNLELGNRGDSLDDSDWIGALDDIQIYDSALTSSEVTFLYNNAGTVIPEPASLLLLALGSLALFRRPRRR